MNQFVSNDEIKEKILEIVSRLEKESLNINNTDIQDTIDTIKDECKEPLWTKKTLRLAFNALKRNATGIAANQLTPIVADALKVISVP